MKISPFPWAFVLVAALAFSGPATQAADKKHRSDKSEAHRVVNRDHSPPGGASRALSRGSLHVASSSSRGSSSKHAIRPKSDHKAPSVRHTGAPERPVFASRSSHSAVSRDTDHHAKPSRQIVTSRDPVTRGHSNDQRDSKSSAIARQHLATSRAHGATRDRSPDPRSHSVNRDSASRHTIAARHPEPSRHRDRSNYVQRHEHHSADWYRSNGWVYDRDYFERHRVHRYCNDRTGVFIIEYNAPYYLDTPYGYGHASTTPYYYGGVDYETRAAVQQALAEAEYYHGPIDGVMGSGTQAAISSYQYDYGLPVSGRIDNALLQSLGLYY